MVAMVRTWQGADDVMITHEITVNIRKTYCDYREVISSGFTVMSNERQGVTLINSDLPPRNCAFNLSNMIYNS